MSNSQLRPRQIALSNDATALALALCDGLLPSSDRLKRRPLVWQSRGCLRRIRASIKLAGADSVADKRQLGWQLFNAANLDRALARG
jgi:hypothetical protein